MNTTEPDTITIDLTLTLTTEAHRALQHEADVQHITLAQRVQDLANDRPQASDWRDVSASNVIAAEIQRLTDERDRARTTAALLEADGARAHQEAVT